MTSGHNHVDVDLFRKAGSAKELCTPKDFASEKLSNFLLSHKTHNKVSVVFHEERYSSNPGDLSALCVANYFFRCLSMPKMHQKYIQSKEFFTNIFL